MAPLPLPDPATLVAAAKLLRANAQPLDQYLFRTSSPDYANPRDIVTGNGSVGPGKRWNPPGRRAVYLAVEEATALAESGRRAVGLGLPKVLVKTLKIIVIRVQVQFAASLDDPSVLGPLGVSMDDFLQEKHADRLPGSPLTIGQSLAEAAAIQGIQALIAPSAARTGGTCVIVFPDVAPSPIFDLPPGDDW